MTHLRAIIAALILACVLPACRPAPIQIDPYDNTTMVEQQLHWEHIQQQRPSAPDTLFASTGRRIYVIGDIDGGFRPRSNPYDLHAYGRPDPNDPLANELQGVWAQPVKGLDGYTYTLTAGGETWQLVDAQRFTHSFAAAEFEYRRGDLSAVRRDYASQDQPILYTSLTLRNESTRPYESDLVFTAHFDLEDAWFTQLGERRNRGEQLSVQGSRLAAAAEVLPDAWAVAVGGDQPPEEARASSRKQNPAGELRYRVRLEPGESRAWTFGIVIETQGGVSTALANLDAWLPLHADALAERQALYRQIAQDGPRLSSPDPAFDAAFALAGANLQALEAESPPLGRYFYAGLEMFPFWFSNDGAYSAVGLLASGLEGSLKNHLRLGAQFAEEGAVPHQISPAGHRAFSSNAQETSQWISGVWDAYRWTGDVDFLREMYPAALEGMFEHTLGRIDPDGDGYASGPGMVEAGGMGEEKLDTTAYTWKALNDLAAMADVLGDDEVAARARQKAQWIADRFDADWWDEPSRSYSMSLDSDNQRAQVPHWAVITPLEVGLATPARAAATLETVRTQYLNPWGIKHTIGDDERVWTLPVAALSRGAYYYGEPELGFQMLERITQTLDYGSIGMFHELIPEGACFIQLWSAATFRRGVIEDLLGIHVDAAGHRLTVTPRLPAGWDMVRLENLRFGEHVVDLEMEADHLRVSVQTGANLDVTFRGVTRRIQAGFVEDF